MPDASHPPVPLAAGRQLYASVPGYAPAPALAVLTDKERLRCPACGHKGSPSRNTCKNCRAPLVKAAKQPAPAPLLPVPVAPAMPGFGG